MRLTKFLYKNLIKMILLATIAIIAIYLIAMKSNSEHLEQITGRLFKLQLPSNIQDVRTAKSIYFEIHPNNSKCTFEGRRTIQSNMSIDEINVFFQNKLTFSKNIHLYVVDTFSAKKDYFDVVLERDGSRFLKFFCKED